jgi:hypothetical protein
MRRLLLPFAASFALVALAQPVDAQLKFGAHGAVITGLDEVTDAGTAVTTINGTFGLGGRVMLDPPLLPVALVGSGTYYLTDDTEPSYYTATLAGQLRLPLPVVKPYATLGYQYRKSEGADAETGFMLGAGLQLDFAVSLFLEGTFEVGDDIAVAAEQLNTNRIVFKGGVLFGG